MEPSIRRGDIIIYLNTGYSVGDVIVYCLSPSHCVAHRVVGFITLDTYDGHITKVVTKGDNVKDTDSPIDVDKVKGKVVAVLQREIWIPLVVVLFAYSAYWFVKTPIIGVTNAVVFAIGIIVIVSVYAFVPEPINLDYIVAPSVNFAGVYLDYSTCLVSIRYNSELKLGNVSVSANLMNSTSSVVPSVMAIKTLEREIILNIHPELFKSAFESGRPILIRVNASLNHVGSIQHEYQLLVGGMNPEVSAYDGVIVIGNRNCFPISVNVSIGTFSDGGFVWYNKTYTVDGFSYLNVRANKQVKTAYALLCWFNQGDKKCVGFPLGSE